MFEFLSSTRGEGMTACSRGQQITVRSAGQALHISNRYELKTQREQWALTSSSLWRCLLPALAGVLTLSTGVLNWGMWLGRIKLGDRRLGTNTLLTWTRPERQDEEEIFSSFRCPGFPEISDRKSYPGDSCVENQTATSLQDQHGIDVLKNKKTGNWELVTQNTCYIYCQYLRIDLRWKRWKFKVQRIAAVLNS